MMSEKLDYITVQGFKSIRSNREATRQTWRIVSIPFSEFHHGLRGTRQPAPAQTVTLVWCNKEAEASLVAGRSAAHGPCREPHPSPVSGGRRADPLSHRQMRILSIGTVGWPRTDVWSAASGGAET